MCEDFCCQVFSVGRSIFTIVQRAGGARLLADWKRPVGQKIGWEQRKILALRTIPIDIKVLYSELRIRTPGMDRGGGDWLLLTMRKEKKLQ
jgi:hypothetical protein